MGPAEQNLVYLVDDDPVSLRLYESALKKVAETRSFSDARSLFAAFQKRPADLVISDIQMADMSGLELLEEIKSAKSYTPVIMATVSSEINDAIEAIQLGAFDYIIKPVQSGQLLKRVSRALKMANLERENKRYLATLKKRDSEVQSQLNLAARIQQNYYPSAPPELPGIDFDFFFKSCDDIGGDFFDFYRFEEKKLAIFMADVAGHGIASALVTPAMKVLSADLFRRKEKPAAFLEEFHLRLKPILPPGMFVVALCATIDLEKQELTYSAAGLEPGFLIYKDGTVERLPPQGRLLAIADKETYREKTFDLGKIKAGYFMTDGLIEAIDGNILTGFAAAEKIAQRLEQEKVEKPCALLYQKIMAQAAEIAFDDDITLISFRPAAATTAS